MAVRLVAGNEVVTLAKTAGLDSIHVDLEHSYVRTADEARAIVAAGSFEAGRGYSRLNAETLVIVQCESGEAVGNAASIAAVEGVDMILVGTNALLAELGITGEFEGARSRAAWLRGLAAERHQ